MKTVIKIGGSILGEQGNLSLAGSIAKFDEGELIVIHGGGPAVTSLCRDLGIEPRFIVSPGGIRSRFTDEATMSAFLMAMRGKINTDIVMKLQKLGRKAFGMSGIDGMTILAERKKRLITIDSRGRKVAIDGGYTGRITQVDCTLLNSLLKSGFTPVISPIALSTEFEALNIDGDRASSAISSATKADRLILFTNVDGVRLNDETLNEIALEDLDEIIMKVGHGMDRKLISAKEAIEGGTGEVIIANGTVEGPIRNALSSEKRTVIRK